MRTQALNIRLTDEELAAFRAVSLPIGLSVSAWARTKLIRAAQADDYAAKQEKLEPRKNVA